MKHIFQILLKNIPYIFLVMPNQYSSINRTMMFKKKKTETLNNFAIFSSVAFEFVWHGTPF